MAQSSTLPPYDSTSALHGRTTFQKPTTTTLLSAAPRPSSHLLGHVTATVDLADVVRTSPHAWQTMQRRSSQVDIINTPLGFIATLATIALLAYLLKQY